MKGRCWLQPAGVSDSEQLPTASRAHGSEQSKARANLHNEKLPKMSNEQTSQGSQQTLLLCWVCPAFVGAARRVLLQSLRGGSDRSWFSHLYSHSEARSSSSEFTSGIQPNHCVPFRWINLPAPSIALQFPLCLSCYVVFLIMPQELCSHFLSCLNTLIGLQDTRQQKQKAVLVLEAFFLM